MIDFFLTRVKGLLQPFSGFLSTVTGGSSPVQSARRRLLYGLLLHMRICEADLHLCLLVSLMSVRLVARSSLLRFEFYIENRKYDELDVPLGSIELDVKEVADFKRLAPGKVSSAEC